MTHRIPSREAIDELVAVGAAIASNCEPCLEHHVGKARELGVPDEDIVRAVQTARVVKAAPARNVARLAGELLHNGAPLSDVTGPPDDSPCSSSTCAVEPTPAVPDRAAL
jgi:AhpD family alkylhydroperoxidase